MFDVVCNLASKKELASHDGAVTSVSVEMTAGGNLERNLDVESLYETDALSSKIEGLVGDPVNFDTTSDFKKATLTFKVDKTKLAEGVDFDNLAVLWYDEASQCYELVPSQLDAVNSTVTATVDHFSTYMLVPLSQWNTTWQIAPKYNFGTHMYAVFDPNNNSPNLNVKTLCEAIGGHPVTITSAEEQGHISLLTAATGKSDRYIIGLTCTSSASDGFKWAIDEPYEYSNWLPGEPAQQSPGLPIRMYGPQAQDSGKWYARGSKSEILAEALGSYSIGYICEWEDYASFQQASSVLDSDGDGLPDFMEIGGIPLPNGRIVYTDPNNPDTDGDGILDGDEFALKVQIVDWDVWHNPIYGITGFIFRSNPVAIDSDGDGINDNDDIRPFSSDTIESMFKLSGKNSPKNPIYIEINGNNVTITAHIYFSGDANKTFPGTNKTFAQVVAKGIENKWTTNIIGTDYDFAPGLTGTVTTRVFYTTSDNAFAGYGQRRRFSIHIDSSSPSFFDSLSPDAHRSNNSTFGGWLVTNPGVITLYYMNKDNVAKEEYQFSSVAAHEFGHALGLFDAYPEANNGKAIENNAEINSGNAYCINGNIMYQNGLVYSNDVEMVLEAFSTNKKQYYFAPNKSRVVRLPQIPKQTS